MDKDTYRELVDNLFHDLVTGLNLIQEAAKAEGIRVRFTADDDRFVVGPYSKLYRLVGSHRFEALGFEPNERANVWIFDASPHRRARSRSS